MQFMEVSKGGLFGKTYAAMVVIAPEDEEHFLAEFSQAGGALHEWKAQRKSSAKEVRLTVVCGERLNDWIRATVISAFDNTPGVDSSYEGVARGRGDLKWRSNARR